MSDSLLRVTGWGPLRFRGETRKEQAALERAESLVSALADSEPASAAAHPAPSGMPAPLESVETIARKARDARVASQRRAAVQTTASPRRLTRRERVVLANLTEDVTLEEVAARLFVPRSTVKSTARSVYRKLGVSSRAEAVEWARELGIGAEANQGESTGAPGHKHARRA